MKDRAFARLDARLDRERDAPVALALSGGGDSMALLHLAAEWAGMRGRALLALTVDHRLNAMSADWTRFAGEAARAVGADWRGLEWRTAEAGPGVTARARAARHGLIAEAARAAGARVVLMAHTADDVREADWMRARGSTLGRVREWSPSPIWPEGRGLMLLRPLLDERREALRGHLRGRGQGWIEDPANADERFGRSRARAALTGGATAETDRAALPPEEGRGLANTSLAWAGVLEIPRDLSAATLAAALLCAGGGRVPPRGERLAGLKARLAGDEDFTAVLAGTRVEAAGATALLMREPGEMRRGPPAPLRLAPGETGVWDRRFEITADAGGARVEAALGRLARLTPQDRAAAARLPAAARATLPVLIRDDDSAPILAWRGAKVRALGVGRLALATGETTQERALFQPVHGETPPTDLFSGLD